MVATIKFSQFVNASLTNTTNRLVGVSAPSGGANFQMPFPLTWTTAARPISPPAGTLGYNTNLSQYEYWNGAAWVQFAAGGSGSVGVGSINELAFYAATGSAVSGFMNSPSSVLTTSAGSVPQWVTTLPAALTLPQPIIQGVTDGSNAASGVVGEFISSIILSPVSLTNNQANDVTFIDLTAGDWDTWGNVFTSPSSTVSATYAWTSTTSATLPGAPLYNSVNPVNGAGGCGVEAPYKRVSVTVTTRLYLSTYAQALSGSISATGAIYARRAR